MQAQTYLLQRPAFTAVSLFSFLIIVFVFYSTPVTAKTANELPQANNIAAPDLLKQMAIATNTLNYASTLIVYRPGTEPVPFVWKHGRKDNVSVEMLSELNGPNAKTIRYGNRVSYFNSDTSAHSLLQSHIHGPFAHNLIRQPEAIQTAYEVIVVGKSRVAGNEAWQVRVLSRDNSRYHYILWVDTSSFLPLKLNTVTVKGELIEQVQATNLTITDNIDDAFVDLTLNDLPAVMHLNPPKSYSLNWGISRLPLGMKEVKRDIHRLSINEDVVEYLLLSDGMVEVSIYLQKATYPQSEDVLFTKDAVTFLSRVTDNIQVSIVGKVPPATAQRFMQMIVSVESVNEPINP